MAKKISKRKLKSYKRAEMVCQEFRYQITNNANRENLSLISDYLIRWVKVTGNIKYERPKKLRKKHD